MAQVNGIDTIATEVQTVQLEPVTEGCARQTRLLLSNVGLQLATFSVTSSSSDISIVESPTELLPGSGQELVLLARSNGTARFVESRLTITLEGQPSQTFDLSARVDAPDTTLPRRIDFGGVEVGGSRALGDIQLTGLSGEFSMGQGQLRFSPSDLGHREQQANYEALLDCPAQSQVLLVGDGVTSLLSGPTELDFGDVMLGTVVERDLVFLSASFDPMIAAFSTGNSDFIIADGTTLRSASRDNAGALVPGASTVKLRFSPQVPGLGTQELGVNVGSRTLLVPLRGVGVN